MLTYYFLALVLLLHTCKSDVIITTDPPNIHDWITRQQKTSFAVIQHNINPPNTTRGFFAASLSTSYPDYFYTWTRDASLVALVLTGLEETNETLLRDYVDFQVHTQDIPTVCNCLGEPKFNKDGSSFTGPWGRPQNDGPAERAIAFMAIAKRLDQDSLFLKDTLYPALLKDLDYIIQVWQEPCFDLWEEVNGVHFYTLMVMRRALLEAVDVLQDTRYASVAQQIEQRIETFWSQEKGYIITAQDFQNGVDKQLDVSVLLAANLVANRNDGFFTPGSDKILATAVTLEEAFKAEYPLNQNLDPHLGVSIGRYPHDLYDGYGLSAGNPWFISTAAYAELYYLAIQEWQTTGLTINAINRRFFEHVYPDGCPSQVYFGPGTMELEQLVSHVSAEADKFLATIQYHQARNVAIMVIWQVLVI
ncbi:hypothetical protein CU098_005411 [Rhizopus stolonifer]|uniref:glucan 1,4-alpha-glucosidase n=1 Tax=Rhizopus stolonifer TaxID=4846 RepID=A0A367KDD7_RHIST|nr:hypothetical protein CU098_005411 [Rhizopus stolonifer]